MLVNLFQPPGEVTAKRYGCFVKNIVFNEIENDPLRKFIQFYYVSMKWKHF